VCAVNVDQAGLAVLIHITQPMRVESYTARMPQPKLPPTAPAEETFAA